MSSSQRFRINAGRITHETLDDEVILVDFELGTYFGLTGVGALIWNAIGEGASLEDLVAVTATHYAGDEAGMGAALATFLDELRREHLVVPCPAEDQQRVAEPIAPPPERMAFSAPVLEKHTDMQDLLLLDPIHEVEDSGWPNRKTSDGS